MEILKIGLALSISLQELAVRHELISGHHPATLPEP
jgi:hypothetical protein